MTPRTNIAHAPSLGTLLALDEQILVIDAVGYWVTFMVNPVPAPPEKPHGLDYSLTLHGPDGERLFGFDNAPTVARKSRPAQDHKHRLRTVRPYDYSRAAKLVGDFWADVEALMRDKGIWS